MAQLNYQTVADTKQIESVTHTNPEPGYGVLLQDLMALTAIISPIIICIGFFFTLKAKTVELERSIVDLGKNIGDSMHNANEILLLKLDAKLNVFSERMDILKCEMKENTEDIKLMKQEIKYMHIAKNDILNQLSKMGIDLYVIGENDRRQQNRLE